jgi:hypothetical protein
VTEWSTSIVAATDSLDLPDSVSFNRMFNLSVSGTNLQIPLELERLTPAAGFRMRHDFTHTVGTPMYYYIHASNQVDDEAPPVVYTAKLIPTADAAYDVEAQYLGVPALLSGGSDEPMVPDEYQEALISWATGKLFLKEFSISQKASEQFSIYAKVLEQARKEVLTPTTDDRIAWGRRQPGILRVKSKDNWVRSRIPTNLG